MLAAHFEDYDTVGQWMAHHLAELAVAAENTSTTTVEQRKQIVEIILKVWSHRQYFPNGAPLSEFSSVFAALDRLGDDRPWKFSRIFDADTEPPDPTASGLPLVTTAAELESLTRKTLLRLIVLAAQDAEEANPEWIEAADKVATNLESEVSTSLVRLQRQAMTRRRLRPDNSPKDSSANATKSAPGTEATHEGGDAAEGLTESGAKDDETKITDDPLDLFSPDDDPDDDPLSDTSHAQHLRAMASLLNKIADALTPEGSAE